MTLQGFTRGLVNEMEKDAFMAGALKAGIEEDIQDQGGNVYAGLRHRRDQRLHRAQ